MSKTYPQPKYKIGDRVYIAYPSDGVGAPRGFLVEQPFTISAMSLLGDKIVYHFEEDDSPYDVVETVLHPTRESLFQALNNWLDDRKTKDEYS